MARCDTRLRDVVGGRTAKPLEKAFGIRTVGDLLRHYPRRLAERGELTDLAALRVGEDVTVLAEVRTAQQDASAPRRAAAARGGRRRRQRHSCSSSSSAGATALARDGAARPAARGLFAGKVGVFNAAGASSRTPIPAARRGRPADAGRRDRLFAGALDPGLPGHQGHPHLDDRRTAVALVLALLDPVADPVPAAIRARHGLLDLDTALRAIHQPEIARRVARGPAAAGLGRGARRAAGAGPAPRRRRRESGHRRGPARSAGCSTAFDARLPFELTAGQREVGRDDRRRAGRAAPDAPAAAGRGRLGQDGRGAAGDAAGRRRRRPGGAARPDRGAGRPARPHDRGPARAARRRPASSAAPTHAHPGRAADRLAARRRPQGGAARRRQRRRRHRRRHARPDPGAGAVRRPRLVVVDEQHRFGVEQRDALRGKAAAAAAPAGHDGDARSRARSP